LDDSRSCGKKSTSGKLNSAKELKMKIGNGLVQRSISTMIFSLAAFVLIGCQSSQNKSAAAPATEPAAVATRPIIRIKAGVTEPYKDPQGNVWLPDQGFDGGDTTERAADLAVAGTDDPALYRTEHFGMTGFSMAVPNGKYIVKLHFADTYEGITGIGQRVFSFNVQGQDFKDFDIWVKAGGGQKAYVQSVPVEVTNGKLQITFTANVENPEINGIEIVPS
jgi:Malectin domain